MVFIPTERFHKCNSIEYHRNHYSMIKDAKPTNLLLGDSIVAGLSRYPNVWPRLHIAMGIAYKI